MLLAVSENNCVNFQTLRSGVRADRGATGFRPEGHGSVPNDYPPGVAGLRFIGEL